MLGPFKIERVGSDDAPPPAIEPAWLLEAVDKAGAFVVNATKDWADVLFEQHGNYETINAFVRYGQSGDAEHEADDARRGRIVQQLHWNLEPDDARRGRIVQQLHWNLDPDGTTRVVLSHADPGLANWLDTQELHRGWLLFRNMLTRDVPDIRTRVVPAADLGRELGSIATRISPEERRAELQRRRAANLRRHPT